jgi:hypothetical protein
LRLLDSFSFALGEKEEESFLRAGGNRRQDGDISFFVSIDMDGHIIRTYLPPS